MEPLDGLADADALLGIPVPLPRVPLPLARWVDVVAHDGGAVEIAWNLDDTRAGTPGRLTLYAGRTPPPDRGLEGATAPVREADGLVHREAPLDAAQPSLRPVRELFWRLGELHLRLTGQGPWDDEELRRIARSVA